MYVERVRKKRRVGEVSRTVSSSFFMCNTCTRISYAVEASVPLGQAVGYSKQSLAYPSRVEGGVAMAGTSAAHPLRVQILSSKIPSCKQT